MESAVLVLLATVAIEAVIYGAARFRVALSRPSRRARLNLT